MMMMMMLHLTEDVTAKYTTSCIHVNKEKKMEVETNERFC
jgi:hypothetical protein